MNLMPDLRDPHNRIDDKLEEILERLNLVEHAVDGRFDNDLDRGTFKRPIGDILRCVETIEDALKEIRGAAKEAAE